MTWDRVAIVEQQLDTSIAAAPAADDRLPPRAPLRPGTTLSAAAAMALFEDQVTSRQLDVAARELKKTNRSFYTIGSAGHENNASSAPACAIDDPAFLHYRSGGFVMARARQLAGSTPILDTLLGVVASSEDPICPGPPQGLGQPRAVDPPADEHDRQPPPQGDGPRLQPRRARSASASRTACPTTRSSSARSATPARTTRRPCRPSTRRATPCAWACRCRSCSCARTTARASACRRRRAGSRTRSASSPTCGTSLADGELDEVWDRRRNGHRPRPDARAARIPAPAHGAAVGPCRQRRRAGLPNAPRDRGRRGAGPARAQCPAAGASWARRHPTSCGTSSRGARARAGRRRGGRAAAAAPDDRGGRRADGAVAPRARPCARRAPRGRRRRARRLVRRDAARGSRRRRTPARSPAASTPHWPTSCCGDPSCCCSARTSGARAACTASRTACRSGSAPRACSTRCSTRRASSASPRERRTSACSRSRRSSTSPTSTTRSTRFAARRPASSSSAPASSATRWSSACPGLAYQKGFGGHFHNDNSVGALRDIPGLVIAAPARGDDAARMLRGAIAMAAEDGRVVVFLEPIALYHEKDLHADGDGGWLSAYPPPPEHRSCPARSACYGDDRSRCGLLLRQLRQRPAAEPPGGDAPRRRARAAGARARPALAQPAADRGDPGAGGRGRRRCSSSTSAARPAAGSPTRSSPTSPSGASARRLASVRAVDSFVPLGPATSAVLVGVDQIVAAAVAAVRAGAHAGGATP